MHNKSNKFVSILIFIVLIFLSNCKKNNGTNSHEVEYDLEKINTAVQDLNNIEEFRSIAISIQGELIIDEYSHGETAVPHANLDVRSVTKSITSLLTGIAIDKGYINSVDQTLSDFITTDIATLNSQFANLTLKQLLTMQAGFDWKEIFEPSEFGEWIRADDQLEYIINKPFINTPGEVFDYSDGAAHLMSIVIEEATGMSTLDFAQENLFDPLDIGRREWYEDNRGYCYGGVGLIITTLDMIKIGELVLNNGVFNGSRIVSKEWLEESTLPHVNTQAGELLGGHYGYYWWLVNTDDYEFYYANGYGGQFIIIIEELDLVITTLNNFVRNGDENWGKIMTTITNEILLAFE